MNVRAAVLASSLLLLEAVARAQTAPARPGRGAASSSSSSSETNAALAHPSAAEQAGKLRDQGNAAMIARRYADALDLYRNALALTPDDASLFYNMARARQFTGDWPGALDALETFDKRATPALKAEVGKLDDLYADLRPRVSELVLSCSEVGARVLVRDRIVGVTPLPPTRLPAGASTVQIELDGFFAETRTVVLPGAGVLKMDVPLHRKAVSSLLSIRSEPLGSTVRVDGKEVGTTSPRLELAVLAGAHEVLVRHEGYEDARVSLVLAAGTTRDVEVPLEKDVPLTSRWYFWTGVGVVVAGGVALTYALLAEKSAGHGTLGSGQVGGP